GGYPRKRQDGGGNRMTTKTINSQIALFRRLALSLPGAVESSHMSHPDFRFNTRSFPPSTAKKKAAESSSSRPTSKQASSTTQPNPTQTAKPAKTIRRPLQ